MRLVFAGTPGCRPCRRCGPCSTVRHEVVAVVTRPDARAGRGRQLAPSPVAELAAEHGHRGAQADQAERPRFRRPARVRSAPTAARWSPTARCSRGRCSTFPPHGWVNLHFSVLPGLAGRRSGPAVADGRRRGDRRDDVPARRGARRRTDVRPVHRDDPPRRHRRHPARPAGRVRRRAARGHPRRHRGRRARGARADRRGAVATPRSSPSPRPRSTGPGRRSRSTGTIRGCTPSPGAWTTLGEAADQGRGRDATRRTATSSAPATWRVAKRGVLVGTGTHARRARRGAAARQAADARRRLGPRAARRRRSGWVSSMTDKTRRAQAAGRASTRPARRRTTPCVLVDTDDAYLNLVLRRAAGERGLTGRDAAFATELAARDGPAAGQLRRDPGPSSSRGGTASLQPEVLTAMLLGAHQLLSMRVPATPRSARRSSWSGPPSGSARCGWSTRWCASCRQPAARRVAGPRSRRRGDTTWSGTCACGTRTRAGWSRRSSTLLGRGRGRAAAGCRQRAAAGHARRSPRAEHGRRAGRRGRHAGTLVAVRRRRSPGGDPGALSDVRLGRARCAGRRLPAGGAGTGRGARSTGRDERWLDLCAGPGGKAALLTGLARIDGAVLVAPERLPHRAVLVRSCVARLRADPSPWSAADGLPPVVAAGDVRPGDRRRSVHAASARCGAGPSRAGVVQPDDVATLVAAPARAAGIGARSVRPGRAAWSPT